MGFDFDVVVIRDQRIVHKHTSGYLTNNFGNLENLVGWYLPKDLHGFCGREVAKRASAAIVRMFEKGYAVGVPDLKNTGWAWGNDMPEKDRVGVLLYHLKRFAEMGEKYPNAYFIADNGCSNQFRDTEDEWQDIVLNEDRGDGEEEEGEDAEDEQQQQQQYVYTTAVRHPAKGNVEITTFDDAMEMFGIFRMQGDEDRAQQWKKLAFTLPGAPADKPQNMSSSPIRGIFMIRSPVK